MDNYNSTTNSVTKPLVEQTILAEIQEGNDIATPTPPTVASALGANPKKDSSEIRLIHDCSRPHGQAFSDYISIDSFKHQSLDAALALLRPNFFMAKIDLRHAYRSVPIHPWNYKATGCKWQFSGSDSFTYFYDARLPFGARAAPIIFHRLTRAVRRMMAKRGFHNVVVYLDDFLVICRTAAECHAAYDTLLQLLTNLGFQISMHKLVPPTQRLVFPGVQLDTLLCQMSLPQPKLRELQTSVSHFSTKLRANKKQLNQLAGKLNWACRVVFGGRTFLRLILVTMNSLTSSSAKCRLSEAFHLDIQWWKDFLAQFNGTRIFLDTLPVVDVHTEACSVAAGAFFKGDWFYHNFRLDSPAHALLHINHKETLAIILAAKRWHQAWSNKHVVIHSGNEAAVHIVNKGSTDNPVIMAEPRALFWLSATFNFRITAQHIKGTLNTVADAISRLHNPTHVFTLNQVLSHWFPAQTHLQAPLHYHISDYSSAFLFSRFAPGNFGTQPSGGNIAV